MKRRGFFEALGGVAAAFALPAAPGAWETILDVEFKPPIVVKFPVGRKERLDRIVAIALTGRVSVLPPGYELQLLEPSNVRS